MRVLPETVHQLGDGEYFIHTGIKTGESGVLNLKCCVLSLKCSPLPDEQIYPGLNANEMHALYDKHHKVSSLMKVNLNTHNSVKYEVV